MSTVGKDLLLPLLAGVWMLDGLCLLAIPLLIVQNVRELLARSPRMLYWEIVSIILGSVLIATSWDGSSWLLWSGVGSTMIAKGLFLLAGPSSWRQPAIEWCLSREAVDYRFVGLGLVTLALLLFRTLGWLAHS
jgi:hypothetical protein